MSQWTEIADDQTLAIVTQALNENGIATEVVETGADAKARVLELIPKQSQVMTMTSVTLDSQGITEVLNDESQYQSVKAMLSAMSDPADQLRKNQLGAAPEYAVGSVHAVTHEGEVLIASNTGSQLPAYLYGAEHVIWVVGAQKIVKDEAEGLQRIYEHILPLERERALKAYGLTSSNPNKVVLFKKEIKPNRIHLIFVKEALGF